MLHQTRRKTRKHCILAFGFALSLLLYPRLYGRKERERIESYIDSEEENYIIPFLRAQGLNNQLWEYRSSAIIAKATHRILCLAPFHRFYLHSGGQEFLSYGDIFDIQNLQKYVGSIQDIQECASTCEGVLHRVIDLVHKPVLSRLTVGRKPYPIADERPGSLDKFKRSTGYREIPNPTMLNINRDRQGVSFSSLFEISRALSKYSGERCIAIAGIIPPNDSEDRLWNKYLVASLAIRRITREVKINAFSSEPYLAVHWRFEESKCAGFGVGIGHGRELKKKKGCKIRW